MEYNHETCQPHFVRYRDYCFLGFLKLSFDRRQLFTEEELNIDKLLRVVFYEDPLKYLSEKSLKDVHIYVKNIDYRGKSVIAYLVIQFYINNDFRNYVNRYHGRYCSVGHPDKMAYCEFAVYDPTTNAEELFNVPNPNDMTTDALRPIGFRKGPLKEGACDKKPLRVINKLAICIHIEISEDEFEMEIRNTFLVVKVNSKEFMFSRWEYEKIGRMVRLCLDDYLTVYKALPRNGEQNPRDKFDATNGDVGIIPIPAFSFALIIFECIYIYMYMYHM